MSKIQNAEDINNHTSSLQHNRETLIKQQSNLVKTMKTYRIEIVMLAALVVLFTVLQLMTGIAVSSVNLKNILQVASPLVLIAFGQLLVMITAGIDLSVGSVYSLSGIVGASVMASHGIFLGVIAALAVGAACGCVNGFFVVKTKLAPFIVTLAMYSIAASLAFIATNGTSITITQDSFTSLNQGHIIPGLPNYILYIIISTIILHFILRKSIFGRWLYATGSNEAAARLVGVPTNRVKFLAYVISGILASAAAIINASLLLTVEGTAGTGLELLAIAAVVIGGASLFGGVGSAIGALIGTLFITGITNGINLLGINTFWGGTITGAVIIAAVMIERSTRKMDR
jgi:ribose transport system permease protein